LTDSRTGNKSIPLIRSGPTGGSGCNFVLGDRQVVVPFTLTIQALTGEIMSFNVTGVPSAGTWPKGNLGYTYSYNTDVQFSTGYNGAKLSSSKGKGGLSSGGKAAIAIIFLLIFFAVVGGVCYYYYNKMKHEERV